MFSMAIPAWSAKVVTSSICLSVNGRTSVRHMKNADQFVLAQHGDGQSGPVRADALGLALLEVWIGKEIVVRCGRCGARAQPVRLRSRDRDGSRSAASTSRNSGWPRNPRGSGTPRRRSAGEPSFRAGQPGSTLDEYRSTGSRSKVDRLMTLQELAGRRLLLQGLGDLAVLRPRAP